MRNFFGVGLEVNVGDLPIVDCDLRRRTERDCSDHVLRLLSLRSQPQYTTMRPPGPALVLYAALSFAAANAFAKALYLRGCTLVSVFLIRCLIVYLFNGTLREKAAPPLVAC